MTKLDDHKAVQFPRSPRERKRKVTRNEEMQFILISNHNADSNVKTITFPNNDEGNRN